jgi:hypothetical protein
MTRPTRTPEQAPEPTDESIELSFGLGSEDWYMSNIREALVAEGSFTKDTINNVVECMSELTAHNRAIKICEKISMPKLVNEDVKEAVENLTLDSIRFLVSMYYTYQKPRIAFTQQRNHLSDEEQGNLTISSFSKLSMSCERFIQTVMEHFSHVHPITAWCVANRGVGPVLSAGLLAHIRILNDKGDVICPTVGHIWSFAGWDPTRKWISSENARTAIKRQGFEPSSLKLIDREAIDKIVEDLGGDRRILFGLRNPKEGEEIRVKDLYNTLVKRPHNAEFKKLCFKLGESFMHVSGHEERNYGHIYRERKEFETEKNANGDYADQAALHEKRVGASTEARKWYKKGMLPPGHIHARAKRYAVKIFLAHLHEVMYRYYVKAAPPKPYPIVHLGHAHEIRPFVPIPESIMS